MGLTAHDKSNITSFGVSVAGTGAVAVSALLAANVVTNTVETEISGSTVHADGALTLESESLAKILGISVDISGSGAVAVSPAISANVIADTTEALIVNNGGIQSNVSAGGTVTMTALDSSEIDAISLNVAGTGAVAVGVSLSGNVIANTVEAEITDSNVTAGGLSMTAEASEIIRSLAVGVAGSGAVAVQVTAIGNVIADQVLAQVAGGSSVITTGGGSVTIQAMDQAPTLVPDWTTRAFPSIARPTTLAIPVRLP